MVSAVAYPGVATMSNKAASGSHSLTCGMSVTWAESRTAGRPATSNHTGSAYSTVGSVPASSSKIHSTARISLDATARRSRSREPAAPDIAS
ncbi:hypothetical protein CEJ39_09835 [Rhodococcus pyridinivorans]|nr:hypothetical protein CEJ39_09835 [Rhodococcus pyridinivorans]